MARASKKYQHLFSRFFFFDDDNLLHRPYPTRRSGARGFAFLFSFLSFLFFDIRHTKPEPNIRYSPSSPLLLDDPTHTLALSWEFGNLAEISINTYFLVPFCLTSGVQP